MKILVTYFSCTNTTKTFAKDIAKKLNADIVEITPEVPYTPEDLIWTNPNSRSSLEMNDLSSRPKIKNLIENINDYDTVIVGYPIWWGKAPTIINSFLESYDLTGKTIIPFGTYHSSGIGESDKYLNPSVPNSNYKNAYGFAHNELDKIDEFIKLI